MFKRILLVISGLFCHNPHNAGRYNENSNDECISRNIQGEQFYLHSLQQSHYFNTFSVLGMILNCIGWWGSSSGGLLSVDYPFIVITSRSTLTWSGSTC